MNTSVINESPLPVLRAGVNENVLYAEFFCSRIRLRLLGPATKQSHPLFMNT